MIVTVKILNGEWVAIFRGGDMPQNIPLPLPYTYQAKTEFVLSDMQRKFPRAKISVV